MPLATGQGRFLQLGSGSSFILYFKRLAKRHLSFVAMRFQNYVSAAALFALPALGGQSSHSSSDNSTDPFKIYNITATNITASFIGYGARLVALYVPDSNGTLQDVVVGYDDPTTYVQDSETNHTFFGAVVGRYANRIKNGTFTIDGNKYQIPTNENGGADTLHGGTVGYDQRNWTVTASTKDSITFSFLDTGYEHFPGTVLNHVTYTVDALRTAVNPKGLPQLTCRIVSMSLTDKTPIMLANHIYWNLDAFQVPTILNNTLHMPLASRVVAGDNILVPNGTIFDVDTAFDGAIDYTTAKQIGADFDHAGGVCGFNCTGVDTCFIDDRVPYYVDGAVVPIIHLSSPATGITLDVATNQVAHQIYTCNGQNGTIPIKASQKARNEAAGKGGVDYVNKHGCIVIETEGWIDAINQPEWGQQEIFSPADAPTVNFATYQFGTL
ncbi:aldose 1-epimerase, putative [Talaromyces stipitatus ATCC 10500]|uniref:Aldose 1-epimerase, putative n=1 Tax=Talaromyces stipitatus (strain ATCC 10500 / CBS 375.48 / QM 6759 / NRRL 1006) TaxID=441959 RepID=B8M6K3_TALSN|nr:aldose 1-epimerase, putative [Talaromyces stipitatus ATCC 10500]EED19465.1 aldose 1-epimerase, putative [Talaromyces stipitatus ATCC 10500]